jgi:glycylpeptide N-tetradecanoyltransferase
LEGDAISDDGPIELAKSLEEIRQEPDPLPKDFEWSMLDISDAVQVRTRFAASTLVYW